MFLFIISFLIFNISLSAAKDTVTEKCVPVQSCPELSAKLHSYLSEDEVKEYQSLVCDVRTKSVRCKIPINEITCGFDSRVDKIIGGNLTSPDEYSWTAQLYTRSDPRAPLKFSCGASIINKRYLLTAAHCIKYGTNDYFNVVSARLGEWNSKTEKDCVDEEEEDCSVPVNISIERIIVHEDFMPGNYLFNDIALIRLSEDITFTKFINPICLQLSSASKSFDFKGKNLKVVGWGRTENGTESDIKLQASLPVVENRRCKQIFPSQRIRDTQICAGGIRNIDSCNGDSGGPLMHSENNKFYLAGIVSYGTQSCGVQGYPGIYTRVSSYIDWIIENMDP